MTLAIFGIGNTALNLAVTLLVFFLVAIWLALIVFTYLDARRRIDDPVLVACATAASLFPFVGTVVYAILRPPEFLEDVKERETEMKAAEMRVRHLKESSCPKCEYPVQIDWLRCPQCRTHLKEPCPSCSKPVNRRWSVCPYCETALSGGRRDRDRDRERSRSRGRSGTSSKRPEGEAKKSSSSSAKPRRKAESSRSSSSGSSSRSSSSGSTSRGSGSSRPSGGSRPKGEGEGGGDAPRRPSGSASRSGETR